jgi:putative endonuclease
MKNYFVYILSSKTKVLYIGLTNILTRRIYEHKLGLVEGFTKKYSVNRLVYYESQPDLKSAIKREKQLKNWHRQWKINLIESKNKGWRDLYPEIEDTYKLLYS